MQTVPRVTPSPLVGQGYRKWLCGAAFSTSPRLRGEVGAKRRVRGRLHKLRLAERPPHPDPLPASGERESEARCLPDDPCGPAYGCAWTLAALMRRASRPVAAPTAKAVI